MIEPSLALDRGGAGSPPDYARPSCVTYSQVALYVQLLIAAALAGHLIDGDLSVATEGSKC